MPRPYGRYAGGVAAYGAASRYAPGTTTVGTMAAGAYAGSTLARTAGVAGPARSAYAQATRGTSRSSNLLGMKALGRAGGIAGAVGGYALARASRALFGKSNNRSTSMRSNYGYR